MTIKDPIILSKVQDTIFANPAYQPQGDETFCNLATQAILSLMGYSGLTGLTADEMYAKISTSDDWLIKPMADAQTLANEGTIIVAILPAVKLGQSHGHVNTLTPGAGDFSGRIRKLQDTLLHESRRVGTCFRNKGENWAFQVIPELYALKETL